MAVVKADGYGHGAVMVAREAIAAGASHLAVATVDEGVVLRRAGIAAPVLVLGPVDLSEVSTAVASRLTLTISDSRFIPVVARTARVIARTEPVPVHLKVDTGMNRFGAKPESAVRIAHQIEARPELRLDGIYSHFADADGEDDTFTMAQADRFASSLGDLRNARISPGIVHISNSAATLRYREFDHDLVRIGIALYGLSPTPAIMLPMELRPTLGVYSRVSRLWNLERGDSVSYGRTYTATRRERIGLVPIGYADGYRRGLSSVGVVRLKGVECAIRGRVCMDQFVLSIPDSIEVHLGDQVEVISPRPGVVNSVAGIARQLDTIDYEVVTGLSRRIPRIYTKGQAVVAVQDLHALGLVAEHS